MDTNCQTCGDRIQIPTTHLLGYKDEIDDYRSFCVTKYLARAMIHTYTLEREREREREREEREPTYLGTFHTSYVICRNVEIFKRYVYFFLRDKNL